MTLYLRVAVPLLTPGRVVLASRQLQLTLVLCISGHHSCTSMSSEESIMPTNPTGKKEQTSSKGGEPCSTCRTMLVKVAMTCQIHLRSLCALCRVPNHLPPDCVCLIGAELPPAMGLSSSRIEDPGQSASAAEASGGGLPLNVIERYRAEVEGDREHEGHFKRGTASAAFKPAKDRSPQWQPR
jgi:hypothetical protein